MVRSAIVFGVLEWKLNIPPLSSEEKTKVFHNMLVHCKVTKFWDVNYKILSRILATPVVLCTVNPNLRTLFCVECGVVVDISHILLTCVATKQIREEICVLMHIQLSDTHWIFGINSTYLLPLIWVVNFGVYKHHLSSFYRQKLSLKISIINELLYYAALFPVLHNLSQIAHNNNSLFQNE